MKGIAVVVAAAEVVAVAENFDIEDSPLVAAAASAVHAIVETVEVESSLVAADFASSWVAAAVAEDSFQSEEFESAAVEDTLDALPLPQGVAFEVQSAFAVFLACCCC